MKPYVICHMVASLDGRTLISRWQPEDARRRDLLEPFHDQLEADAWLIGRVTGQGYAKRDAYPNHTDRRYAREAWFAGVPPMPTASCSTRTAKSHGAAAMSAAIPLSSC
jgi:hypothetical protein